MDNETTDEELTSSMGSVLSPSNKDDKNDASDSTPTSSTDAHSSGATSQILTDDPISSTSSDIQELKVKEAVMDKQFSLPVVPVSSDRSEITASNSALLVSDADLLYMNITDVSDEKITEDVEDIVQDLENLLGESSSFTTSQGQTTNSEESCKASYIENELVDKKEEEMDIDSEQLEAKSLGVGEENVSSDTKSKFSQLNMEGITSPVSIPETQNIEESASNIEQIDVLEQIRSPVHEKNFEAVGASSTANPQTTELDAAIQGMLDNNFPVSDIINTNQDEAELDDGMQCEQTVSTEVITNDDLLTSVEPNQINETKGEEDVSKTDVDNAVEEVSSHTENCKSECLLLHPEETPIELMQTEEDIENTPEFGVEKVVDDLPEQNVSQPSPKYIEKHKDTVTSENIVEIQEDKSQITEQNIEKVEVIQSTVSEQDTINVTEHLQSNLLVEDVSMTSHKLVNDELLNTGVEPRIIKETAYICGPDGPDGPDRPDGVKVDTETSLEENAQSAVENTEDNVVSITESNKINVEQKLIHLSDEQEIPKDDKKVSMSEEGMQIFTIEESFEQTPTELLKTEEIDACTIRSDSLTGDTSSQEHQLSGVQTDESCSTVTDESASIAQNNHLENFDMGASIEVAEVKGGENIEKSEEIISSELTSDLENKIVESDMDVVKSSLEKETAVTDALKILTCEPKEVSLTEPIEDTEITESPEHSQIPGSFDTDNKELAMDEDGQIGNEREIISEQNDGEKVDDVEALITINKNTDGPSVNANKIEDIEMIEECKMELSIERSLEEKQSSLCNKEQFQLSSVEEEIGHNTVEVPEVYVDLDNTKKAEVVTSSKTLGYTKDTQQGGTEEMATAIEAGEACKSEKDHKSVCSGSADKLEISGENELPLTPISSSLEERPLEHNVVTDTTDKPICIDINAETNANLKKPLSVKIEDDDKVELVNSYSPKIKIKPQKSPLKDSELDMEEKEELKGSLKMTITKQSDTLHSILKVHTSDEESCATSKVDDSEVNRDSHELSVPKLIIKSVSEQTELPLSPKMTTRSSKLVPNSTQRSSSPRITIKPIVKPDNKSEVVSPLKITISKSKNDDTHKQKHSPKSTRSSKMESDVGKDHLREHHTLRKSLKSKQADSQDHSHSPRVTIKPIVKPSEESDQGVNPKIIIKPILKPFDGSIESLSGQSPRVTIKPIIKPLDEDEDDDVEMVEQCLVDKASPKITIKPVVKPIENEPPPTDFEESIKERIVLKINKSRKRELLSEDDRSEKLAKIKLKFSKEGGHPHIVQQEESHKRQCDTDYDQEKSKRQRTDTKQHQTTESHSKLKDILSCNTRSMKTHYINEETVCSDDVMIIKDIGSEVSDDSTMKEDNIDPLADIPIFEITPDGAKTVSNPLPSDSLTAPVPKKRGRPRKVPLQIREDFKDENAQQVEVVPVPTTVALELPPVQESSRPKRSCRGQSVRATLGIKPRKPRGASRSRGVSRAITTKVAKRGRGGRGSSRGKKKSRTICKSPQMKESVSVLAEEAKLLAFQKAQEIVINVIDVKCSLPAPTLPESTSLEIVPEKIEPEKIEPENTELENTKLVSTDIVMFEEETRMSADISSRAQTPTKQMITCDVEESQSSVQSSATTESVKVRKGPRLEVHQEPEGAVISADQLAEYCWSGSGPFMLQEQVAQFLGIKSFKRKYPNIQRRTVDMQERDFIRESGLASEAMCDLGLTAVTSADILDIMYADFQEKYEEYCKHQRNRQAKDLINKQKALSLAASQEKTKLDITEQAVHSAAMWNASFNKVRREQRKACMDLQTMTVHYPKGRVKQIPKEKVGSYPVAVVPGQFTDYYKEFTPTEINNLPLNTMCYDSISRMEDMECDSQSDDSGSGSDSSTSSSDTSDSDSSDDEDCKICNNNKSPTTKVASAPGKTNSDKATSPHSKAPVQTTRTSGPVTRVTSTRSKVVPAHLR